LSPSGILCNIGVYKSNGESFWRKTKNADKNNDNEKQKTQAFNCGHYQ